MKLMYRGTEYNYEPVSVNMSETGNISETGITGQYRGQAFTFAYPRHIPVPQPVGDYKYRGVSYRRTEDGGVEAITPAGTNPAGTNPAGTTPAGTTPAGTNSPLVPGMTYRSVAATRKTLLKETAGKHQDNIQRRLQHRLEVAQAKGDQQLVSQLEREMQYIAR